MYRYLIAFALVGSAFGCATPNGGASSSNKNGAAQVTVLAADGKPDLDKSYICEMVSDVGSHIPERLCRSLRQIDADRVAASDVGVVPPSNSGGIKGMGGN